MSGKTRGVRSTRPKPAPASEGADNNRAPPILRRPHFVAVHLADDWLRGELPNGAAASLCATIQRVQRLLTGTDEATIRAEFFAIVDALDQYTAERDGRRLMPRFRGFEPAQRAQTCYRSVAAQYWDLIAKVWGARNRDVARDLAIIALGEAAHGWLHEADEAASLWVTVQRAERNRLKALQRASGRRGGQASKEREWARLAAEKYVALPFEQAWEKLPDEDCDLPNFGPWVVFRQGDELHAINAKDEAVKLPTPMKKSTFGKYHQRARRQRSGK